MEEYTQSNIYKEIKKSEETRRNKWERDFMRTRKGWSANQWLDEKERIKYEIEYLEKLLTKSATMRPREVEDIILKLEESKYKLYKAQKENVRAAQKEEEYLKVKQGRIANKYNTEKKNKNRIFKRISIAIATSVVTLLSVIGALNVVSWFRDNVKTVKDNKQTVSDTLEPGCKKMGPNTKAQDDSTEYSIEDNNLESNVQENTTESYIANNSKQNSFKENLKVSQDVIDAGKEKFENTKLENSIYNFKLGDTVELGEGIKYSESSDGKGRQGEIGSIPWRPVGEYIIDGIAVLNDKNEIINYVYNEPGVSVKDFLEENSSINTHNAYHISTIPKKGEKKGAQTGWAQENEIRESLVKKYNEGRQAIDMVR